MGLTARGNQDWIPYIPEFGDNRDDPNPTRMDIRPMSPSLYSSWHSRMTARVGFAAKRLEGSYGTIDVDKLPAESFDLPPEEVDRIIKYCVGEVENYSSEVTEDDADGKPVQALKRIRNARDLLHRGDPGVVFELLTKVIAMSLVSEARAGNSTGRPGSSSPNPPEISEEESAASATGKSE